MRFSEYCEKKESEEPSNAMKRGMMNAFIPSDRNVCQKGAIFITYPIIKACDIIERKLQAGLDVWTAKKSRENVICPYHRVSCGNANTDTELEQHKKYASYFPGLKREFNTGLHILTTIISMHRNYGEI